MDECGETGCKEKATHKYRARSGFKVPLCDKHYKEWEEYEYQRSPIMMLIELGKWFIRLTGVLMISFGVLAVGLTTYTLLVGGKVSFDTYFFELHLHLEDARIILIMETVTLLVGIALFYIGFFKTEHDLW